MSIRSHKNVLCGDFLAAQCFYHREHSSILVRELRFHVLHGAVRRRRRRRRRRGRGRDRG